MLRLNIVNELRSIFRNHWLTSISVLLMTLCLYAGWNGANHVAQRSVNITQAVNSMHENDILMAAQLDSIAEGFSVNLQPWWYPTSPTAVGDQYPRVAAFHPGPMTFISTGQSDMFSHYVKPIMTGESFTLGFTELTSPVSLLMGQFDLAFVIVYLLPLVIISFCYNILSIEKERGSLVMVGSSPLNVKVWLLQKVVVRFLAISLLLSLCLVLTLLLSGNGFTEGTFDILSTTWIYSAFWFALAYLLNLRGKSSARNAIVMLGLWVVFVLAIPSLASQWANATYPVPSRALLVNEMRTLKAEVSKEQDKLLDDYLRNHPELIAVSGDSNASVRRTQQYFAAKDMVEQRIQPLLNTYNSRLEKQKTWVSRFAYLSPAILTQNSLNHIAETSSQHYDAYRQNVRDFAVEWRDFFLPITFEGKNFEKEMISEFPEFIFDKSGINSPLLVNSIALLIMVFGLTIAALSIRDAKEMERIMN